VARSIEHCENCGADLGRPVVKYPHDFITCGSRECEREAQTQMAIQQQEAHDRLDEENGWQRF
jgi:hypothetical protein